MKLLSTTFYILMCNEVYAELYSALSGMEALLETEAVLLESLYAYVTYHENQIQLLKMRYNIHAADYEIARKNPTNYLSNPINAFKVIKELYVDWKVTEEILYNDKTEDFSGGLENLKSSLVFPDNDDLVGAVEGLIRLQDIYQLDTAELADGILKGKKESTPMTMGDCFEIGRQASILGYHNHSLKWMNAALSKYKKLNYNDTILESKIQEYRAFSQYNIGDFAAAVNSTQKLLLLTPGDLKQVGMLAIYKHLKKKIDAGETIQFQNINKRYPADKNYEELCRDEMDIPEHVKKDLKCRYESEKSPFLRLAPVKVEEYYLDPYIAVFHDVIYEDEIRLIIDTAKTRLTRALVLDLNKRRGEKKSGSRVTKTAWMLDDEHEIIQRINQRIEDVTGLSMETAECLQIANYGTGGHYEPHWDSTLNTEKYGFITDDDGNRIATFIFYLSDVDQGGRTVFPKLGVGVTPRKGSALFWYNLHTSGETDTATLHGACPVLLGNKWIANKWIRQRNQEFRRLCGLEYVKEGLKKKYPEPVPKVKSKY